MDADDMSTSQAGSFAEPGPSRLSVDSTEDAIYHIITADATGSLASLFLPCSSSQGVVKAEEAMNTVLHPIKITNASGEKVAPATARAVQRMTQGQLFGRPVVSLEFSSLGTSC